MKPLCTQCSSPEKQPLKPRNLQKNTVLHMLAQVYAKCGRRCQENFLAVWLNMIEEVLHLVLSSSSHDRTHLQPQIYLVEKESVPLSLYRLQITHYILNLNYHHCCCSVRNYPGCNFSRFRLLLWVSQGLARRDLGNVVLARHVFKPFNFLFLSWFCFYFCYFWPPTWQAFLCYICFDALM